MVPGCTSDIGDGQPCTCVGTSQNPQRAGRCAPEDQSGNRSAQRTASAGLKAWPVPFDHAFLVNDDRRPGLPGAWGVGDRPTSNESLLIVSLIAQSKGTSGDISCKITVNGAVVKENKSSGEYAVVICSNN